MNSFPSIPRFYTVELVQFRQDSLSAFESRAVLIPTVERTSQSPVSEDQLVNSMEGQDYQEAVRELLKTCQGLRLRFDFGKVGTSIRVITSERRPLTIAWLFPSGRQGWMGLYDLTLGVDDGSLQLHPAMESVMGSYFAELQTIPGARIVRTKGLRAVHIPPQVLVKELPRITEVISRVVQATNEPE